MTPAQAERWKKTRSRGKKRHVLLTGVLGWGCPMTIAMTALAYFQSPGRAVPIGLLWTNLLLYTTGGVIFGLWTWAYSEKRYKRYLADAGMPEPDA